MNLSSVILSVCLLNFKNTPTKTLSKCTNIHPKLKDVCKSWLLIVNRGITSLKFKMQNDRTEAGLELRHAIKYKL